MRSFSRLRLSAAAVLIGGLAIGGVAVAETFSSHVDAKGNIALPKDYRATWAFLGAWSIAGEDKEGGAKEIHAVYAKPEVIAAYRKTGKWPDGAMLIKETRSTVTRDLTTGRASSAKDVGVVFIMVKDTKGRFKGNKLWGDGWGWALYKGGDLTKQVATDYKADCLGCHVPAQKTDWIYVEGYPVLRK